MMYLQQLYRVNKFWFVVVFFFMGGQLFINYKRGIVITPLYHYGMYSRKATMPNTIELYEIVINGKVLQPFHFSSQKWDKFILPIEEYCKMEKHNNDLFLKEINRVLHKVSFVPNSKNFMIEKTPNQFLAWYKKYTSKIISIPINQIEIHKSIYNIINEKESISFKFSNSKSFIEACK